MNRVLRALPPPILRMAALILCIACAGDGEEARPRVAADTAGGRLGETAGAPAAQSPAQSVNYDVDRNDVRAALEYDSVTKTVTYPIVSGLTSANSAWNFNGFANGRMTIVVPLGAAVVMPFSNMDGNVPHSFGVTNDNPRNIPPVPGPIVFPGAETRRFETGLRSTERDIVRFTADKAGRYMFPCGVPGHAVGGMWIRFEVSPTARRPEVRVASGG